MNQTVKVYAGITGVIILFLLIISIFYITGGFSPVLKDSSDAIVYPNNCSEGTDGAGIKLAFNTSDLTCYNSTQASLYTAKIYSLPLTGLFTFDGILFIVLIIIIFIVVLLLILKAMKKE